MESSNAKPRDTGGAAKNYVSDRQVTQMSLKAIAIDRFLRRLTEQRWSWKRSEYGVNSEPRTISADPIRNASNHQRKEYKDVQSKRSSKSHQS